MAAEAVAAARAIMARRDCAEAMFQGESSGREEGMRNREEERGGRKKEER